MTPPHRYIIIHFIFVHAHELKATPKVNCVLGHQTINTGCFDMVLFAESEFRVKQSSIN